MHVHVRYWFTNRIVRSLFGMLRISAPNCSWRQDSWQRWRMPDKKYIIQSVGWSIFHPIRSTIALICISVSSFSTMKSNPSHWAKLLRSSKHNQIMLSRKGYQPKCHVTYSTFLTGILLIFAKHKTCVWNLALVKIRNQQCFNGRLSGMLFSGSRLTT